MLEGSEPSSTASGSQSSEAVGEDSNPTINPDVTTDLDLLSSFITEKNLT